jgi:alkylation response protein AidB-like acyl-CoA dehydrogenase
MAEVADEAGAEASAASQQLVERAAELFPVLRGNAVGADRERRPSDEGVEAMIDGGTFRVWTPRRYGGFEADVPTHQGVIEQLARGCPSTGWTTAMMTPTTWLTCLLPEHAQRTAGQRPRRVRCRARWFAHAYARTPVTRCAHARTPWTSSCTSPVRRPWPRATFCSSSTET